MPLCFPKIYQRAMDLDGMGCGRDIGGVGGGETVIREKKLFAIEETKEILCIHARVQIDIKHWK